MKSITRKLITAGLILGLLLGGCTTSSKTSSSSGKQSSSGSQNSSGDQSSASAQSSASSQSSAGSQSEAEASETSDEAAARDLSDVLNAGYESKTLPEAGLYCGDAKFFKDKIVTNVLNALTLVNYDGTIDRIYDCRANWIDGIDDENLLVYGNFYNEIGILTFDDDYNIISNQIIMTTDNLQIDPTINKVGDTYYLTVTEIIGTVNNMDPDVENGEYILHMYSSKNLTDWKLVYDIVDEKCNIEDIDVNVIDGTFYVIYEKEVIDMGESSICLKTSFDNGESWSKEIELLPADCDHEQATFETYKDGFLLLYSCDIDNPGMSYAGSKVYYARFDDDMNLLVKDRHIITQEDVGLLLYDTRESDGRMYLLYTVDDDYSSNLIVE